MLLGAYWAQREAPLDQAAERTARFLRQCAEASDLLANWYRKGRSRAASKEPVLLDGAALAAEFAVQRRDDNKQVMSELGFRLGIWNGAAASFATTIGAFSPAVHNRAVLSFSEEPPFGAADWRRLLASAIAAFDPDAAVVTSLEHLEKVGADEPQEAGWFLYRRGGEITEHPFP